MSLPELFVNQIKGILPDEYLMLIDAINEDAKVSIRVNPSKVHDFKSGLLKVSWCNTGYYLAKREPFTFDPAFHGGQYYVQDASSMILQHIVGEITKNSRGVRYLDLCAAPGGKSTAAVDTLPDGSLMVSNEIVGSRAHILRENIIKWGLPNCVVTNNDSAQIGELTHFFDIVAADVPCSGEGMFRKDDEAVKQWTPALVAQCVARQKEIVDNIWDAIAPGGYFIYSTCTYNRDENESMIDYIASKHGAESVDMNFPTEWNIHAGVATEHHCYRFMPHCTAGEGLFVCVMRKCGDEPRDNYCQKALKKLEKDKKGGVKTLVPNDVKVWVKDPKNYNFIADNDSIVAVKSNIADAIAVLKKELRVFHYGVPLATIKGKSIIPDHALALSIELDASSFDVANLDYATAIAYLRGEAITLFDSPKGNLLVQYEGNNIGFVKNLGNRANNPYPHEWRIRSAHIPPIPPSILK